MTHRLPPAGPAPADARCPVIGIGCSAGGLEALERFFSQVPADSGLAFVVVQHLSPSHASALPELLRGIARVPVLEVRDGTPVVPDHVYVIPPDRDLALRRGRLHLIESSVPRGLRLPIDAFLRSLAEDRQAQSIGVVLSGMGSDGLAGLSAIKAAGGLALVQDPTTAQADSMPSSAIQAGVADIVAAPEALPGHIARHLRRPLAQAVAVPTEDETPDAGALEQISTLLRERTGTDFTRYKVNTLLRRIERRMAVRAVTGIDAYASLLRGEPYELDLLFRELLIGVTSFFRDPGVWEVLIDSALPYLMTLHPQGKALRAWVPACSTGEEAYSLAMAFTEALERARPPGRFSLQIFATDLDADAIEVGRRGVYPDTIAADVKAERLARHFTAEAGGFRIDKRLRESVVFATQNIAADPPFTKLDILSCRNLLIYFNAELQKKLLPLFHYALTPGGLLVLGSAETAGTAGQHFAPIHAKHRIYRRNPQPPSLSGLPIATRHVAPAAAPTMSSSDEADAHIGPLTDQIIQQHWAPAAVLVNGDGDIVYISGRTGRYLEPAAGKTNVNVHAMAREGLRDALPGMIRKALKEQTTVVLSRLRIGTNGGSQVVDVTLQPIDKPEPLRGHVLVVFKDVPEVPARRRRRGAASTEPPEALALELQQVREALRVSQEAMQTTVEELKSSNEELQSTNEELQSSNEELTTSKEELQSLNEELQTVNAELQSKVDELTGIRNDMANLLNSTEIATVFLDDAMNLRRYTTHATKIFRLIEGDVGRPLAHLVSDLDHPGLIDDALEVLRSLVFREKVVATHDGRWYRVRTMPYRTHENVIDGVVMTFTDITEIMLLEAELRKPRS